MIVPKSSKTNAMINQVYQGTMISFARPRAAAVHEFVSEQGQAPAFELADVTGEFMSR